MPLITVVIVLILFGLILWAIEKYLPLSLSIKRLIEIVIVVAIVLWLLQIFGLLDAITAVKVGKSFILPEFLFG